MPRRDTLYEWQAFVATLLPDHPPALTRNLAAWAYAAVLQRALGLTALATALAHLLGQAVNTARQRLRELYQPADRKAGASRTTFAPDTLTAPLVRWVTRHWPDHRLPLVLDASNLGDRFTLLAVAVAIRGVAIPVAWRVFDGGQKSGAWNDHWADMVGRVRAAVAADWRVYVFTDRGLESPHLFARLVGCGCHPLMRVKAGGHFRPAGWRRFRPMGGFARADGVRFAAAGEAYQGRKMSCTLLACRVSGCEDPWLILTDLPAGQADPLWYAFRGWVEQLFRAAKRGEWEWQRTRMTHPERAERVWAVVAVATAWAVSVGGPVADGPTWAVAACPAVGASQPGERPGVRAKRAERVRARAGNSPKRERAGRVVSVGRTVILIGLLRGELRVGRILPEPWPEVVPIPPVTEDEFDKQNATYP